MITLLKISQSQANNLANKVDEVYTPCYSSTSLQYYFYKTSYTASEIPNTVTLPYTYADGLTPVNPSKPMFPKKTK